MPRVSTGATRTGAPVAEYVTTGYRARWVLLTVRIIANIAAGRRVQHEHGERQRTKAASRRSRPPGLDAGIAWKEAEAKQQAVGPTNCPFWSHKRDSSVPASTTQHSKSGTMLLDRPHFIGSIHQLQSRVTKACISSGVYVPGGACRGRVTRGRKA